MYRYLKLALAITMIGGAAPALGQDDREELQIAAMEALIAAPAERAYPLAAKVVRGNYSDEVKERALFVLSQIDTPEAQSILLEVARDSNGELRRQAIRVIGIGGNEDALSQLAEVYASSDREVREAVLEAYLIADDADAVARIAENATDSDEFEEAVEILAAMGAREHLRALSRGGASKALVEAAGISGDVDYLREVASDDTDPELQKHALEALGIDGSDEANALLLEFYRGATSDDVRTAALDGMMISGYDEGVLELYRASRDPEEKRELLEMLVAMDSEAIYEVIDAALSGDQ